MDKEVSTSYTATNCDKVTEEAQEKGTYSAFDLYVDHTPTEDYPPFRATITVWGQSLADVAEQIHFASEAVCDEAEAQL